MFRRAALLSTLLLGPAACAGAAAFAPPDAEPFTPPVVYRTWWLAVEACSGLQGDFESVQWFVVPTGGQVVDPTGRPVRALWVRAGNRIILQAADTAQPHTPQHEMLHALLQLPGHPREYFVTRCHLGVN